MNRITITREVTKMRERWIADRPGASHIGQGENPIKALGVPVLLNANKMGFEIEIDYIGEKKC